MRFINVLLTYLLTYNIFMKLIYISENAFLLPLET